MVLREEKKISLLSRNKKNLDATFPELQEQLPSLSRADFIADGEIVAFEGKITSFGKLQERLPIRNSYADTPASPKVFLYLFDLLYFDGCELEQAPLTKRKQLLKECLSWSDPIRYTPYRKEKGKKYLDEACRKGWEGLIAKNGQAPYTHNRSKQWLKFKCVNRQELVIGGFTDPKGGRQGFGALLVGYYRNGELLYAGKVGTGFNDEFLKEWGEKFKKKRRDTSPFADYSDSRNGRNHWIRPKFVGQFEFTEWTAAGKLRHPSFIGMRYDKEPENVIKETEDEIS
jgi:DNA ligase D-like protein (predicted ligase)